MKLNLYFPKAMTSESKSKSPSKAAVNAAKKKAKAAQAIVNKASAGEIKAAQAELKDLRREMSALTRARDKDVKAVESTYASGINTVQKNIDKQIKKLDNLGGSVSEVSVTEDAPEDVEDEDSAV